MNGVGVGVFCTPYACLMAKDDEICVCLGGVRALWYVWEWCGWVCVLGRSGVGVREGGWECFWEENLFSGAKDDDVCGCFVCGIAFWCV